MKYSAIIVVIVLALIGCKDELLQPLDESIYGYEYYPLEVGKFRIYRVDSIQFDVGANDLPIQDSSTFYVRDDVVEIFQDATGADVYRIERYRSADPGGPWSIQDVVTQSRTTNQAYYTENNIRQINLVFPMRQGERWDGNAFIKDDINVFIRGEAIEMYKGWDYEVLSVDNSESLGDIAFENVATVQQADNDNEIEFRFSREKYAKNIGLIFRHREIMDSYCKYIGTNESCVGKAWREKAGRGFIMREILIAHN